MIPMTRQKIIIAMQDRQILMTKGLQDAIMKMSDQVLAARWEGIQLLAESHKPGNRPGWMGKHFINPTTLHAGQKELERKAQAEAQRQEYLKKKQAETAAEAELSREKLKFWRRCTTKRKLLEKHLPKMNDCFQELIRKNYLDKNCDFESLPEKEALFYFWYLIPPFETARAPPLYVPFEKAS